MHDASLAYLNVSDASELPSFYMSIAAVSAPDTLVATLVTSVCYTLVASTLHGAFKTAAFKTMKQAILVGLVTAVLVISSISVPLSELALMHDNAFHAW